MAGEDSRRPARTPARIGQHHRVAAKSLGKLRDLPHAGRVRARKKPHGDVIWQPTQQAVAGVLLGDGGRDAYQRRVEDEHAVNHHQTQAGARFATQLDRVGQGPFRPPGAVMGHKDGPWHRPLSRHRFDVPDVSSAHIN